jgi:hypothetical protein
MIETSSRNPHLFPSRTSLSGRSEILTSGNTTSLQNGLKNASRLASHFSLLLCMLKSRRCRAWLLTKRCRHASNVLHKLGAKRGKLHFEDTFVLWFWEEERAYHIETGDIGLSCVTGGSGVNHHQEERAVTVCIPFSPV